MPVSQKGTKPYNENENPATDAEKNKAEFGNRMYDVDNVTDINKEGAKPAVEGKASPAKLTELFTKVEKSHQGTGPGWNTRRPQAGK